MSTFRSTNPARPAEVVIELPEHGEADVDLAVQQAAEAQRAWAARPVPERAEAVAAVGAVLTARKAELAELVSREAGKVRIEGGGEVQEAIDMAAFVAGQGRSAMGEVVPSEMPSKIAWTTRIPVGRRRDDHAVELPDGHPELEDLPRAARRQRRRDEALRAGAGVRRRLRRGVRRGRHPGRPPPGRARRRRAGRRARHAPWRRRGVVHRLGAHRPQGGRGGDGGRAEARQPRARRQERHGRARRRRPRPRARRRPVRCVRHLGPALHLHVAARSCSAASPARSSSGSWSAPRRCVLGDPLAADTDVGPGDHRRVRAPHRRDDRGGGRRGRHGRHRRAPARRGGRLRGRHLRRPHDPHRREAHPHGRPRGGVRPGARRSSRSTTSTRRSAS